MTPATEKNYQGPGRYRHYKGEDYEVLGLALHESQLHRLVIYRPLDPGSKLDGTPNTFWACPEDDFNALLAPNPDQPRILVRRFFLLPDQ